MKRIYKNNFLTVLYKIYILCCNKKNKGNFIKQLFFFNSMCCFFKKKKYYKPRLHKYLLLQKMFNVYIKNTMAFKLYHISIHPKNIIINAFKIVD